MANGDIYNFFSDAPKSLGIQENRYLLNSTTGLTDPVDRVIMKFQSHPSILQILEDVCSISFSFKTISLYNLENVIRHLNHKKAGIHNDIPAQNFIQNYDICVRLLLPIVNYSILQTTFPGHLTLADITPTQKDSDVTNKKKYRPISILPVLSKVFERVLENQITTFVNEFPFMCGYRKRYSMQYALIAVIEKMKRSLDSHGYSGALFIDLSKAFDTLNHDILIAKLHAYGYDKVSLKLIQSCLSQRWHRTKINTLKE